MKRNALANIVYAKAQELRKEADRLSRVAGQIDSGVLKGNAVGDAMRIRLSDSKLGYGSARTTAYNMFGKK